MLAVEAPEAAAGATLVVDQVHQAPQELPRLQEEAPADQAPADQAITTLTVVHLLREDMVTPTIAVGSLFMSIMELELTTTISSMA